MIWPFLTFRPHQGPSLRPLCSLGKGHHLFPNNKPAELQGPCSRACPRLGPHACLSSAYLHLIAGACFLFHVARSTYLGPRTEPGMKKVLKKYLILYSFNWQTKFILDFPLSATQWLRG